MQWDRNYTSSEVEDRRGENGAGVDLGGFGGGGGGGGLFLIIRLLSMFGWKGILVGLVIAGVVMAGGQCTNLASHHAPTSNTSPASSSGPVQASPDEKEEVHFVGFVFDDIQKYWRDEMPGLPRRTPRAVSTRHSLGVWHGLDRGRARSIARTIRRSTSTSRSTTSSRTSSARPASSRRRT